MHTGGLSMSKKPRRVSRPQTRKQYNLFSAATWIMYNKLRKLKTAKKKT